MKLQDSNERVYTLETYLSNIKLATGQKEVNFFKKQATEDKNYSNETNTFSSSHGGVVTIMRAELYDTDYSTLVISSSTIGILKGYSTIRNAGFIEFKRGKDLLCSVPLKKILPPAPIVFVPEKFGNPVDGYIPAPVPVLAESLNQKYEFNFMKAIKKEIFFNPKEQLDVDLKFIGNVAIPVELNGRILSIELDTRPFATAGLTPAQMKAKAQAQAQARNRRKQLAA